MRTLALELAPEMIRVVNSFTRSVGIRFLIQNNDAM